MVIGTTASTPCLLAGFARARLVDDRGYTSVEAGVASPPPDQVRWVVLAAQSAPLAEPTESKPGQALVIIESYGDCEGKTFFAIVLTFLSGELTTPGHEERVLGRCDLPGQRLVVAAQPLEPVR